MDIYISFTCVYLQPVHYCFIADCIKMLQTLKIFVYIFHVYILFRRHVIYNKSLSHEPVLVAINLQHFLKTLAQKKAPPKIL